jgi:anti-repressor protein
MYVISRTRTETSKRLNRWLFGEVIPQIRKTGMYATPEIVDKFLDDPDLLIQMLAKFKADRAKQVAVMEDLRKLIDATTRNTATPRMEDAGEG